MPIKKEQFAVLYEMWRALRYNDVLKISKKHLEKVTVFGLDSQNRKEIKENSLTKELTRVHTTAINWV